MTSATSALEAAACTQEAQAEELERRAAILRQNAADYRAAALAERRRFFTDFGPEDPVWIPDPRFGFKLSRRRE